MYKSFFKQKTAYEIAQCLVGSEMCIRDRECSGRKFAGEDIGFVDEVEAYFLSLIHI
ncbi:hypothetical protein JMUB7555_27330 [Staphylococcus aureus]